MDRNILEGDPHSVIEGIIIAAYAVARPAVISMFARVPDGGARCREAIAQARQKNFLGDNILETGFSLTWRSAPALGFCLR